MRHTRCIMIKHLLLTLLAIVASTTVITAQDQQEQTATPEIEVESYSYGDIHIQVITEEEVEISLFINGSPISQGNDYNYYYHYNNGQESVYIISYYALGLEGEEITISAYAQANGKSPSEMVSIAYTVPSKTAPPTITVLDDDIYDDDDYYDYYDDWYDYILFSCEDGADIFFWIDGEYGCASKNCRPVLDGNGNVVYELVIDMSGSEADTVIIEAYAQCGERVPSEWVSYTHIVPERTIELEISNTIDYEVGCAYISIYCEDEGAEINFFILDKSENVLYEGIYNEPIALSDYGRFYIYAYAKSPNKRRSFSRYYDIDIDEFTFFPYYPTFDFSKDGIYYKITSDSTVKVTYMTDEVLDICSNFYPSYSGDVIVPETVEDRESHIYTVTEIGENAFFDCVSLNSISLPNTITRIGYRAFGKTGLESIFVPASVNLIHPEAFIGCDKLISVQVDEDNPTYDSRDNCNAIIETATNTLVCGSISTIIPQSVTALGDNCFGGFFVVSHLRSIIIPDNVLIIGKCAFEECAFIEDIKIGSSVTTIGEGAFMADSLKHIALPASVETIGDHAFYFNRYLVDITCKSIMPPTASNLLSTDDYFSNYKTVKLFVPNESIEAYRTHEEWGKFTYIVPFIGAGPGDVDGDGNISIKDATCLIDVLLSGGELPAYYDVDGNGTVSIKDVTVLIDMLLGGN